MKGDKIPNPKSKIPIARPTSDSALTQKSKNNVIDVSRSPASKSVNDSKSVFEIPRKSDINDEWCGESQNRVLSNLELSVNRPTSDSALAQKSKNNVIDASRSSASKSVNDSKSLFEIPGKSDINDEWCGESQNRVLSNLELSVNRPTSDSALKQKSKNNVIDASPSLSSKSVNDSKSAFEIPGQSDVNDEWSGESQNRVLSNLELSVNCTIGGGDTEKAAQDRDAFSPSLSRIAYVVRINKVDGRDVLVTEEIGPRWTTRAASQDLKEDPETYGSPQVGVHSRESEVRYHDDKESNFSTGGENVFENTDGDLNKTLYLSSLRNGTFLQERHSSFTGLNQSKSTLSEQKSNVNTLTSLYENTTENQNSKRETKEQTGKSIRDLHKDDSAKLHDRRPTSFNSWTISRPNTRATYLGSNIREHPRYQKEISNKTTEEIVSNITSEVTFVKENSAGLSRTKSAHNSERQRRKVSRSGTFRISSSKSDNDRNLTPRTNSKGEMERFEEVKFDIGKSKNKVESHLPPEKFISFQQRITELSKKRIPVRKKSKIDSINSDNESIQLMSNEKDKETTLERLNNRNTHSAEEDRSSVISYRSVANMSRDLKIVKQKVKETVWNELQKNHGALWFKKNVLHNLNKNTNKKSKDKVNNLFLHESKLASDHLNNGVQSNSQSQSTVGVQTNDFRVIGTTHVQLGAKKTKRLRHRSKIKDAGTQTVLHVQPKIHRFKPKRDRRKKPVPYDSSSTHTDLSGQNNIHTWLKHSYRTEIKRSEKRIKTTHTKVHHVMHSILEHRHPKRRPSTFSLQINQGQYLPVQKFSKRKTNRRGQTSTRVGYYKGYEVSY